MGPDTSPNHTELAFPGFVDTWEVGLPAPIHSTEPSQKRSRAQFPPLGGTLL
jgi:hypothetical protein